MYIVIETKCKVSNKHVICNFYIAINYYLISTKSFFNCILSVEIWKSDGNETVYKSVYMK